VIVLRQIKSTTGRPVDLLRRMRKVANVRIQRAPQAVRWNERLGTVALCSFRMPMPMTSQTLPRPPSSELGTTIRAVGNFLLAFGVIHMPQPLLRNFFANALATNYDTDMLIPRRSLKNHDSTQVHAAFGEFFATSITGSITQN
jgi:hypothetical protein